MFLVFYIITLLKLLGKIKLSIDVPFDGSDSNETLPNMLFYNDKEIKLVNVGRWIDDSRMVTGYLASMNCTSFLTDKNLEMNIFLEDKVNIGDSPINNTVSFSNSDMVKLFKTSDQPLDFYICDTTITAIPETCLVTVLGPDIVYHIKEDKYALICNPINYYINGFGDSSLLSNFKNVTMAAVMCAGNGTNCLTPIVINSKRTPTY